MIADSREDRSGPSPLQKIIPIVLLIGALGYIVAYVMRDSDPWAFIQIGAAGALFVYFLTFVDIVLGLGILIACVGFSPQISIGGLEHLRLEDFVVPALLMTWLMRAGQRREPLQRTWIGGPATIYILAMILSTLVGMAMDTTRFREGMELLSKYVEYFAIYLLILNNVRTEQEFKALAVFSVLVGSASAVFSSGSALTDQSITSKVQGPLGENANTYGGYLILNLSIAIGFFMEAPRRGVRFAAGLAIALLGIPLLHTYSRTSAVSIVAALLIFGLFVERRVVVLLMILSALVVLTAPGVVLDRLMTVAGIASGENYSWSARRLAWDLYVPRVLSANPVVGFGAGSVNRGDVDSEYVRALVDSGVLGLGVFCWILLRIIRMAFVRIGQLRGPGFHKGFAAGYLLAALALCVHAIAATSFTSIRTGEQFMVLSGLYFCQVNRFAGWTEPPRSTQVIALPPSRQERALL